MGNRVKLVNGDEERQVMQLSGAEWKCNYKMKGNPKYNINVYINIAHNNYNPYYVMSCDNHSNKLTRPELHSSKSIGHLISCSRSCRKTGSWEISQ